MPGTDAPEPSDTAHPAPDVPPEARPRHIAIIMDGNGRWARQQGQPRTFGHQRGAEVARDIALFCAELGIEALTLYSFSTENWKRPEEEVQFLMQLGQQQLRAERENMGRYNIRFRHVGSRAGLPDRILTDLDEIVDQTAGNTGMTLSLALNYGARSELTEATRCIARKAAEGTLDPERIGPETIAEHLYTAPLPDPDLLIRTAGEMRISNFLLWQVSYAEFWVTDVPWPEFGPRQLSGAIEEFARRRRRFGGVK